eukprot:1136247-Pelagomonas_calceolata.AAC.1
MGCKSTSCRCCCFCGHDAIAAMIIMQLKVAFKQLVPQNAMLMPVVLQDIAHPGTDHPSGSEPGAGAAEGGGRPGSVEATTPGAAHKRGKPREESHA